LSENKPGDFIRPPRSKVIKLVARPRLSNTFKTSVAAG